MQLIIAPKTCDREALVVRTVREEEVDRFHNWMAYRHYLGAPRLVGRSLLQVAHLQAHPYTWVALLAWTEGALRYAARDSWIGWNPLQRRKRRHLVLLNTRFLLLPEHGRSNLGSQVLRRALQHLPQGWNSRHGVHPLLAETFVDASRFSGTVYQAAGWFRLGETAGFARAQDQRRFHGQKKIAFALPLVVNAQHLLASEWLDSDKSHHLLLGNHAINELFDAIAQIPDPRNQRGKVFPALPGLWTAMVATELAGMDPLRDLTKWLQLQPRSTWRFFGCRGSLQTATPIIPSIATRRRARAAFENGGGQAVVDQWLNQYHAKRYLLNVA